MVWFFRVERIKMLNSQVGFQLKGYWWKTKPYCFPEVALKILCYWGSHQQLHTECYQKFLTIFPQILDTILIRNYTQNKTLTPQTISHKKPCLFLKDVKVFPLFKSTKNFHHPCRDVRFKFLCWSPRQIHILKTDELSKIFLFSENIYWGRINTLIFKEQNKLHTPKKKLSKTLLLKSSSPFRWLFSSFTVIVLLVPHSALS